MPGYKQFKIEAVHDDKYYKVLVKGWFPIWKSGFVHTNYFACHYDSKQRALRAIEAYKNRFTAA